MIKVIKENKRKSALYRFCVRRVNSEKETATRKTRYEKPLKKNTLEEWKKNCGNVFLI